MPDNIVIAVITAVISTMSGLAGVWLALAQARREGVEAETMLDNATLANFTAVWSAYQEAFNQLVERDKQLVGLNRRLEELAVENERLERRVKQLEIDYSTAKARADKAELNVRQLTEQLDYEIRRRHDAEDKIKAFEDAMKWTGDKDERTTDS